MNKMINTVTGPMSVDEIGPALTHEHIIFNIRDLYRIAHPDWPMSDVKVSVETRDEIMKDFHSMVFGYADNLVFDDEELAVRELAHAKAAGVKTIVDCTTVDLAFNPRSLKRISERTGINIIMSYGYYHFPSLSQKKRDAIMSGGANYLADEIIVAVNDGIDGIYPGVIKIGPGEDEGSKILMNSAAIAQRETGLPVMVHSAPFEMIEIFEKHKANTEKLVMDHWSAGCPVREAISAGAWVSFDQFGMNFPGIIPDTDRIDEVMQMVNDGLSYHLLLSQDMCWKVRLKSFGGTGYGWLFTDIKQSLMEKGLTEQQWNDIICGNVKRLFA